MVDTGKDTTQSQASAPTHPANKPPVTGDKTSPATGDKKPPGTAAKPKKSGGGCLVSLFFLVILGASGYLYLRIERPDILSIANDNLNKFYPSNADNGDYDDNGYGDSSDYGNNSDNSDRSDRIDELERRLDNFSKTPHKHDYGQQIQRLAAEQQDIIKRLDEQASGGFSSSSSSAALQIQLVDLALRASGDVTAAVNALRHIKLNNPAALEEEISRLEKIPNREKILLQIKEIRTLTSKITTSITAENKTISGAIISLFNIRKIKDKKTEVLQEHLKSMELRLLAGHQEDYLNALSAAVKIWQEVAGDTPDANISSLFELLLEYGMPDYHVQLHIDGF